MEEPKITGYLLSQEHADGRHKAAFFMGFGFAIEQWEVLADALRDHAQVQPVTRTVQSNYGTRYVVEGELTAADGRRPLLRSVWIIEAGTDVPRFVTAYPL